MDHYNESDVPVYINSSQIREQPPYAAQSPFSREPSVGRGVPGLWPETDLLHGGCHMNKWILVICVFLMLLPLSGPYAELPKKATYHLFTNGVSAGTNKIETTEKNGRIILTSVTSYAYGDNVLELTSTTEADAKTFQTLRIKYKGHRNNRPVAGDFTLNSDTLTGTMTDDGNEFPFNAKLSGDGTFAMQQNTLEHMMLLIQNFVPTEKFMKTFQLFFPISTTIGTTNAHFESEREIPVGDKMVVCKKITMRMQLSDLFIVFVDPATNYPIYALYPSTKWEAFLESSFGEDPLTFYRHPEPMEEPIEESPEE
jgi:hypothetical protein